MSSRYNYQEVQSSVSLSPHRNGRSNSAHKHLKQKGLIKIAPLLLLSTSLVSCNVQTNNQPAITPSSSEIKIPISSFPIEVAPLFKPNFLEQISIHCEKKAARRSTHYGSWQEFRKCKLPVIEQFPSIKRFMIHRNKSNDINAYSFLSLHSQVVNYLNDKYRGSFHSNVYYCAKNGDGLLLRFFVVKSELCSALLYKQL